MVGLVLRRTRPWWHEPQISVCGQHASLIAFIVTVVIISRVQIEVPIAVHQVLVDDTEPFLILAPILGCEAVLFARVDVQLPRQVGKHGDLERLVQVDAKLELGLIFGLVNDELVLLERRCSGVRVLGIGWRVDDQLAFVPAQRPLVKQRNNLSSQQASTSNFFAQ